MFRTENQAKASYRKYLENEGEIDEYLEDGKLNRAKFNKAYKQSKFSGNSVQHYYGWNTKLAIAVFSLDEIKDMKIRKPRAEGTGVQYEIDIVSTTNHSSTNSESEDYEDVEAEEIPQFDQF